MRVLALALVLAAAHLPPSASPPGTDALTPARSPKILRVAYGRQLTAFVAAVSGAATTTRGAGGADLFAAADQPGENLPVLPRYQQEDPLAAARPAGCSGLIRRGPWRFGR